MGARISRVSRVPIALALTLAVLLGSVGAATGGFQTLAIGKYSPTGEQLTRWAVDEYDMNLAASGTYVYTVDRDNDRIRIYTQEGVLVSTFGSRGTKAGQFKLSDTWPRGAVATRLDEVYVLDPGNHRVQVFRPEGAYLRKWGRKGTGSSQLNKPTDLAIDAKGFVYVIDSNRVKKFSSTGSFVKSWGKKGTKTGMFKYGASDVAIDSAGSVYVTDTSGNSEDGFAPGRVVKFTSTGKHLRTWTGAKTPSKGFFSPHLDIAIDPSDNIYVNAYYADAVYRFSPAGDLTGTITGPDTVDGNSAGGPMSITVDLLGNLYVAGSTSG